MKLKLYDYIFKDLSLLENASVLDVGCQNSTSLKYMKEKFALNGELVGIDKRGKDFDNVEGIKLIEMDASQPLLFPDNHFDFIFHKDTLECITDIPTHIKNLHRILKPNGKIICVHRDWESIVINGDNKKLINKIIYEYANFLQGSWMDDCDGWIGRRLWGYFCKDFDGEIDCYNDIETQFEKGKRGYRYINDMKNFINKFISQDEYNEFIADIEKSTEEGTYLFSSPFYIFSGVKK